MYDHNQNKQGYIINLPVLKAINGKFAKKSVQLVNFAELHNQLHFH